MRTCVAHPCSKMHTSRSTYVKPLSVLLSPLTPVDRSVDLTTEDDPIMTPRTANHQRTCLPTDPCMAPTCQRHLPPLLLPLVPLLLLPLLSTNHLSNDLPNHQPVPLVSHRVSCEGHKAAIGGRLRRRHHIGRRE